MSPATRLILATLLHRALRCRPRADAIGVITLIVDILVPPAAEARLFSDNQGGCRIASSRNAPERVEHCLTRMLPTPRQFVNRQRGLAA